MEEEPAHGGQSEQDDQQRQPHANGSRNGLLFAVLGGKQPGFHEEAWSA